jgi:hypothetical protein
MNSRLVDIAISKSITAVHVDLSRFNAIDIRQFEASRFIQKLARSRLGR